MESTSRWAQDPVGTAATEHGEVLLEDGDNSPGTPQRLSFVIKAATGPIQFLPRWDVNNWTRKLYLKLPVCASWGERGEESPGEEACMTARGTPTDAAWPCPTHLAASYLWDTRVI